MYMQQVVEAVLELLAWLDSQRNKGLAGASSSTASGGGSGVAGVPDPYYSEAWQLVLLALSLMLTPQVCAGLRETLFVLGGVWG